MESPITITPLHNCPVGQDRWSNRRDRSVRVLVGYLAGWRTADKVCTTSAVVEALSVDGRTVRTESGTIYRIAGSGPIDWPEYVKRTA